MGSSKKRLHAASKTKGPLIDTVEIAPGIRFPLKRLLTEDGRQEAELLRREWLRKNRDPKHYVRPEKLRVRLRDCANTYLELDAQKFILRVAQQISKIASYGLGFGEHPDAPRIVVERVRKILRAKIEGELWEFIGGLTEDIFFETLLSLEGELRFSFDRAELRKEWGKRVTKRASKKRRKILAREGLFPTPYLLRVALSEAVEALLKKDPGKKITQSAVVKYFSEGDKYASCGDESTLRLWLRTHGIQNWRELIKDLRREHETKPRLRV
jgi:hypothetical protein